MLRHHPSRDLEVTAFLATVPFNASAAQIRKRCQQTLALASRAHKALEARQGPATIDADFADFDTLNLLLDDGRSEMGLIAETSPVKAVRAAADNCLPRLSDAATAAGLSRPIYDRLSAIPALGLDMATAYTLDKALIRLPPCRSRQGSGDARQGGTAAAEDHRHGPLLCKEHPRGQG